MNWILCAARWADDTVGHIAEWLPRNLQVDDGAAAGGIARSLNCVGRATAAEYALHSISRAQAMKDSAPMETRGSMEHR
jgi:hypothetical protein